MLVVSRRTAVGTPLAIAFGRPDILDLVPATFIERRLNDLSRLSRLRFVEYPELWPRTATQGTRARPSDLARHSMRLERPLESVNEEEVRIAVDWHPSPPDGLTACLSLGLRAWDWYGAPLQLLTDDALTLFGVVKEGGRSLFERLV